MVGVGDMGVVPSASTNERRWRNIDCRCSNVAAVVVTELPDTSVIETVAIAKSLDAALVAAPV